jgi:glycosyltransferase involved in cell wall biosynthesis
VITFGRHFVSTWIAQVYAILNKKHCIHIEQANSKHKFKNPIYTVIQSLQDIFITGPLLSKVDIILPGSNSVRTFLEAEFRLKNVSSETVYSFLDLNELSKLDLRSRELKEFNKQKINILFAARLVEVKGFKYFLELADILKDSSKYNFILIGGADGQKQVEKYAESHKKNFHYLGEQSRITTLQYIRQCDMFLNLSSMEGLPTNLLEARYFKRKVLATNIGPNVEALENYDNYELCKQDITSILHKITCLEGKIQKGEKEVFPKKFTKDRTLSVIKSQINKF